MSKLNMHKLIVTMNSQNQHVADIGAMSYNSANSKLPKTAWKVAEVARIRVDHARNFEPNSTYPPTTKLKNATRNNTMKCTKSMAAARSVANNTASRGCCS